MPWSFDPILVIILTEGMLFFYLIERYKIPFAKCRISAYNVISGGKSFRSTKTPRSNTMEYSKNTIYYPNSTFGRRSAPQSAPAFAEQSMQKQNSCLSGMSLAMVYSPCQQFEGLYEPAEALRYGTLFTKLNLPFVGRGKQC